MHITNPLLHLCALASTVSAFYPYVPGYECLQDGSCAVAAKRASSSDFLEEIGKTGSIEVKIKKRKAQARRPTYNGRISRYVERLASPFAKRASSYMLAPSIKPSLPNSAAINQDGGDLSYIATMKFGSSGKELNVLIDTGASTTWVMGKSCTTEACLQHNTFGQPDSTTLNTTTKAFELNYGTGDVKGTWARDTVELAGFKLAMDFGLGKDVSKEFLHYPMDGILGLASVPGTGELGFVASLVNQGLIQWPVFGVNLHRSADGTNDGSITFGAIDNSKFVGEVAYTAAVPQANGAWMIPVGDAGFNGKKAGLGGKIAVIDTGTSYCFLPLADAKKFYATIADAKISEDTQYYTVPCDTTTPAEFTFGGVTYEIPAKDWVNQKALPDGRCPSNIFSRDASGGSNAWLMGDTFIKNVYTVFDVGQNRIGFASKSGSSTSSSASSTSSGTTPVTSFYKVPSRFSTTGKSAPILTKTEELSSVSSAGPSSSSSSTPDGPSDSSMDVPSTSTSTSAPPTTVSTSTWTTSDLPSSTDSSSATSTGSSTAQTGAPGGFTGFTSGDDDDETIPSSQIPAPTPSSTSPPDSGAASLSTTSLALFAASLVASIALFA